MQTIVLAVLVMTLGDAAAAIGGRVWGKKRLFQHNKTLEGTLCNLLVSFATVFVANRSVPLSMLAALTAATVEATVPGIWDNPAVLLALLLLLSYFNNVQ
jgi:dolichol kinase